MMYKPDLVHIMRRGQIFDLSILPNGTVTEEGTYRVNGKQK
jgi:hypothetical protein